MSGAPMECEECGSEDLVQDFNSGHFTCRQCGVINHALTQQFGEVDIGDQGENVTGRKQQVVSIRIKKDAAARKEAQMTQLDRDLRDLEDEAGDYDEITGLKRKKRKKNGPDWDESAE
ncbi:unnamed protein product, partial [Amoebophrya sp. A120]|eukprot:GSA120T00006070001.1